MDSLVEFALSTTWLYIVTFLSGICFSNYLRYRTMKTHEVLILGLVWMLFTIAYLCNLYLGARVPPLSLILFLMTLYFAVLVVGMYVGWVYKKEPRGESSICNVSYISNPFALLILPVTVASMILLLAIFSFWWW